MYFDEGRHLNHNEYRESNASSRRTLSRPPSTDPLFLRGERRAPSALKSPGEDPLDTARNRLQELMQLLYLLSRDPRVPQDARYHVTVAQSEIALLSKVMQNNAEAAARVEQPSDRCNSTHP